MFPESKMASVAISFAVGILMAAYCGPVVWLSLGALAVLAACAIWPSATRPTVYIVAALYALGAGWYCARMQVPGDDISRLRYVSAFEGSIASDPDLGSGRVRLLVSAKRALIGEEWREVSGFVLTTLYLDRDRQTDLSYGESIRVSARPYAPSEPTNPGQFSWKGYLERQGIRSCATVRNAADIARIGSSAGIGVVAAALTAKHYLASSIERIHPSQQASVIIGMVLGTYSYLPRTTFDNFSKTGTLHLLAASGFNCFVLAMMATWVLRRLGLTPKWISIVSIALLVFYLLMVGAKPSLVRATVMAGLWLLAVPLRRVPNIRSLFFTAALVTLAISPTDLFDAGFQLSFAAVWALITSGSIAEQAMRFWKPAEAKRARRRGWLRRAWQWLGKELSSAAAATITVSLFTAPIVAYHFNYVSLVSLPANIALALGVYVLFGVGLMAAVVACVPGFGCVVGFLGTKVTDALLAIVNYLGSLEYSAVTVPKPGLLAIAGYYVLLYVGLDYLRSKLAER